MNIREATMSDFSTVCSLEQECFIDPYSREQMTYEFNVNPVNKILVAEEDEKVVGFINYMITFNSATIGQVAVTKQYRGKGIATKLLAAMEETFPKNIDDVVETVTLEVRESNIPAINLYKKNGYEFVVMKNKYYSNGENAIYMVKRLLCQ